MAAPAGAFTVVLQMPRGNLEAVAPRPLVLALLGAALSRHDYHRAWTLATSQRVDLNLIVDYAWPSFLDHAGEFLGALGKTAGEDACELMLALRPGSVLAPGGPYAGLPSLVAVAAQGAGESVARDVSTSGADGSTAAAARGKVAAVCAALRAAAEAADPHRYAIVHLIFTEFSVVSNQLRHGAVLRSGELPATSHALVDCMLSHNLQVLK